jgi:8-oxo-dGTP diphosphatase
VLRRRFPVPCPGDFHRAAARAAGEAPLAGLGPAGGRVEAGETPREAARREFREETGLDGRLLETPAAVTVRAYREGWTPTLGLSYAAVLDGSLDPAGESRQPAAWTPLPCDWEGAFPGDRPRIRAFAGHLKASWRAATA